MRLPFILLFLFGSLLAKPLVLVSVPPQKFLVESIAGDACDVEVLVPSGSSPHTYEPKARQIDRIQEAAIWFRIGEGFESRLLSLVKNIVDPRENLDLLGCRCHGGADPHIWLSPKLLKSQAVQIHRELKSILECDLEENLALLLTQLDELDDSLSKREFPEAILVSHPAFGYFCRDYGIEQLSVEMEGKEPSVRQLTSLIKTVQERELGTIFLQRQYSKRGGLRVAKRLDLQVHYLDPYAEDVIANLEKIGEMICD
ncbi:MAG: High-affinity zinc uptake system binding-protein ZnuA [Chlamydiales bacterium]|nr:High-affinity zinc uptake system binding-protein ZnuA [Chlamydiales bacterium]MCH9635638.1 High-affinity zinc uptake system binding-protein ZnuA [Chlamydiales bacterium]